MREEGVRDMNFLDAKDSRFQDFRKTLDARMKELASRGISQTSRSLNSRISLRESDGKTYFDFETLGAHQRILMWDFTRGTSFAKSSKSIHTIGKPRRLYDILVYESLVEQRPFYRRSLPGPEIRFGIHPIKVNKLGTIIKTMCLSRVY